MNKNLIIIGICILFIGIILALLFRPAPTPILIGKLTNEQETELRANLATLATENDSLRTELGKSKAEGIEAAKAFTIEIKTKVRTIAELKARPVVVQLVQDTPALDSLHKAYDGAMVAYEGRNMALTLEMQTRDRLTNELVTNFETRLASTEQLLADKTMEVGELQRDNKKLKRRLFWTKVTGVVILGGVVALSL